MEQPVQLLPCSQITWGRGVSQQLFQAQRSVLLNPRAAAEMPQYLRKSRRVIAIFIPPPVRGLRLAEPFFQSERGSSGPVIDGGADGSAEKDSQAPGGSDHYRQHLGQAAKSLSQQFATFHPPNSSAP